MSKNFPLSSFDTPEGKETFPNFPCYQSILNMLEKLANSIRLEISKLISKADKVVIQVDSWSHPSHGRYLCVVLRFGVNGEIFEYPVHLEQPPHHTLGSEEMKNIIQKTLVNFNIPQRKLLSLSSDGASDMETLAELLALEWDRCLLHLLNLRFKNFWDNAIERVDHVHRLLSRLKSRSIWKEFVREHRSEYKELGGKMSITIGSDTRWCTRIDEVNRVCHFQQIIVDFQHQM